MVGFDWYSSVSAFKRIRAEGSIELIELYPQLRQNHSSLAWVGIIHFSTKFGRPRQPYFRGSLRISSEWSLRAKTASNSGMSSLLRSSHYGLLSVYIKMRRRGGDDQGHASKMQG